MSEHASPYLRRREVIALLEPLGTGLVGHFEKLVEVGTIRGIRLSEGARAYYLRTEIERHLLEPFRAAERRLDSANARTPGRPDPATNHDS